MSRRGKKPILLGEGVSVTFEGGVVVARGSKGEGHLRVDPELSLEVGDGCLSLSPRKDTRSCRARLGMQRTLFCNLIRGVTLGFDKELALVGVGYRASVEEGSVRLSLGKSHEVVERIPEGVTVVSPKATELVVSGVDKQKVGQFANILRMKRPPEPYKGKGVHFKNQIILRKEGKKK